MAKVPIASIESHFSELTDPRRNDSRTRHKLMDILVIAIWPSSVVPITGSPLNRLAMRIIGYLDSYNYPTVSRPMTPLVECLAIFNCSSNDRGSLMI